MYFPTAKALHSLKLFARNVKEANNLPAKFFGNYKKRKEFTMDEKPGSPNIKAMGPF
jgi:hypothetical protein